MVELVNVIIPVLIIDFIITGSISFVLYRRYKATKIKAVLLATLFFTLDTIWAITEFVLVATRIDNYRMIYLDPAQPSQIIFSALGILGAGTFLLFINFYIREEVSITHIAVIFSVLFTFLTYSFMTFYLNLHDITYPSLSVPGTPISFEFLPAILITYLLIVTVPQLIKMLRETNIPKQRYVVISLLITMFFYFVNTSVFITLSNQLEVTGDTYIILNSLAPRISVIIGDTIFLVTYVRIPAAYLHDQTIEKLLVITQSGLLIYSQDFNGIERSEDGDVLLSGGLSAISSMLAETINVSELETIEFKEKDILIEHQPTIGYFLITDRPSQFLKNALSSVGSLFPNLVGLDEKKSMNEEITKDDKVVEKLNQIFGV